MNALEGRRILVTGGSRGIGAAIARAVAAEGARPALLARHNGALRQVAGETGAWAASTDLADPAAVTRSIQAAADALGGLDSLVNNAGTFRLGRVADGVYSDWRDMVDVNILGLLAATKAAVPYLAESDTAQILNISSMSGRRVVGPAQGPYAGTKHAVHAISTALRQELHGVGIRVTVLAPGVVRTNLGRYITDPAARSEAETKQRTWGLDPSDLAAEVVHILAAPRDVHVLEIDITSARQPPPLSQ
jgi:clavulanate-9-aldehyde reducatase